MLILVLRVGCRCLQGGGRIFQVEYRVRTGCLVTGPKACLVEGVIQLFTPAHDCLSISIAVAVRLDILYFALTHGLLVLFVYCARSWLLWWAFCLASPRQMSMVDQGQQGMNYAGGNRSHAIDAVLSFQSTEHLHLKNLGDPT